MMRALSMVAIILVSLFLPSVRMLAATVHPDSAVLQGIETNLLSIFGFQRRPRPAGNPIIPAAILDLYQHKSGDELDTTNLPLPGKHTSTANTVRTFTHTVSSIDSRFSTQHRFRLWFDVSNIPAEERLQAAELQLHRESLPASSVYLQVEVHDILSPGTRGSRSASLALIDSRIVNTGDGGSSLNVDLTPAVVRWLESKKHNHGLLVSISELDGDNQSIPKHVRLRREVDEHVTTWFPKQPLLFTYTDDGRQVERKLGQILSRAKRSKGSASSPKKHKRKENCRRHALYVDFADVGWNDWIVAPPGYEAYYCHGDCPFPLADHLNSTNHAIVQTLVNSVNPAAVPKACCVPTQLTSISMLYLDEENKVVLKNYQDMAVSGCGCR